MTGNQSTTTLKDEITVSGPATTFMTQHGGGDCVGNTPAAVRFFFRSPSASGSSVGTPPAGFYTQFWWSNPISMQLVSGSQSQTITASMSDMSEWSDWNGKPAATVPEAFPEAIQNVQAIGCHLVASASSKQASLPNTRGLRHRTRCSPVSSVRPPS